MEGYIRIIGGMRRKSKRVIVLVFIVCALASAVIIWRLNQDSEISRIADSLALFADLPANTWTRISAGNDGGWTRQGHAGLAYDTKRGTLLLFGSDTHGENWDNTVHEFIPALREWRTLGAEARPETYAATPYGQPVAGDGTPQPWAMHTYDGIEYDPTLDALIVAAAMDHTPVRISGVGDQRTWIFERATSQWRVLDEQGSARPSLFGSALAYDEWRDTLVLCKGGVWELGPDRLAWQRVRGSDHCGLHHNLVFDADRGRLMVFGSYSGTSDIWAYTPGINAGMPGTWSQLKSVACPVMSAIPAAYDRQAHRFVLIAAPNRAARKGRYQTYLYDPDAGRCEEIAGAVIEAGKMNFMMIWHRELKLTLLVTGDWKERLAVWALSVAHD